MTHDSVQKLRYFDYFHETMHYSYFHTIITLGPMSAFGKYRKHIAKTSVKFDENRGHQGQGHQIFFQKLLIVEYSIKL